MTEKKLTQGSGRLESLPRSWPKSLPWIGVAALSGLMLSAPVVVSRWRRRTYQKQEDWMNAYIRGCLSRNRRSS